MQVFQTGRGRNTVILEAARLLWLTQALLDVKISYSHIEGPKNILADSLSRIHLDPRYYSKAIATSNNGYLCPVFPCLLALDRLYSSLLSRAGLPVVAGKGTGASAEGQGVGD